MIIAYYGRGKGKTSAGIGSYIRAVGSGMKGAVIHLFKTSSSEDKLLKDVGEVYFYNTGKWIEHSKDDREIVEHSIAKAYMLIDKGIEVLFIDEILTGLYFQLLSVTTLEEIFKRAGRTLLIVTGICFPDSLRSYVDILSEVCFMKHPFEVGLLPVKGVEF